VTDGNKEDAYNAAGPCEKHRKGNGAFFVSAAALYLLIVVCMIALTKEVVGETEGGLKKLRTGGAKFARRMATGRNGIRRRSHFPETARAVTNIEGAAGN
jgi:hypothetical protein